MKKVILLFLVLAMSGKWALAQEENNIKNFRFGLKATGMLTWYKPEDKKKYTSDGVSAKGGYGLIMEFRLNKVASIATGFQVDYFGGKLNFLDTTYYYLSKDSEFETRAQADTTSSVLYQLNSRVYNTTYVTLPFTLKLKTPEIGALTYFGMFGINTSLRMKSRTNDAVRSVKTGGSTSNNDILNTKDMNLMMFALNIGGGAEWNLAGSTSLVFGINFYNGFSNVVQSDSEFLFRSKSNNYDVTKQSARASGFALSFGVLF
ncbi:MAG: PorT family protein [Bacteroidota bacterium]|nr:PorT family protein [Bacteroidota bacterium]